MQCEASCEPEAVVKAHSGRAGLRTDHRATQPGQLRREVLRPVSDAPGTSVLACIAGATLAQRDTCVSVPNGDAPPALRQTVRQCICLFANEGLCTCVRTWFHDRQDAVVSFARSHCHSHSGTKRTG